MLGSPPHLKHVMSFHGLPFHCVHRNTEHTPKPPQYWSNSKLFPHRALFRDYGGRFETGFTRTLYNAFQAAVTVSLSHRDILFKAASKWNKQTKGMLGNLLDSIERARDAARTPREKGAKKRQVNGITPDLIMDVRNAIFN